LPPNGASEQESVWNDDANLDSRSDYPSLWIKSATPPTGTKSPRGWASGNERIEPRDERKRT